MISITQLLWVIYKSILKKNVPWHILAPRAVACDNLHLRASAHLWHVSAFLCNREFLGISCYIKKVPDIVFTMPGRIFRGATRFHRSVFLESQLLRAYGTPTVAASIRNPGYRPTYSCRLGCQMYIHPDVQARHSGYPLDNTFKQK